MFSWPDDPILTAIFCQQLGEVNVKCVRGLGVIACGSDLGLTISIKSLYSLLNSVQILRGVRRI